MQNILNYDEVSMAEKEAELQKFMEEEAELRKMAERFKEEKAKPEVKLLCHKLEQGKSLTPEDEGPAKLALCIIVGLETSLDLKSVRMLVFWRVIAIVDNVLPSSLISQDAELQATVNFVRKIRDELGGSETADAGTRTEYLGWKLRKAGATL
jgi:hypothetical protein